MAIYTNLTIDQGTDYLTNITVEDATGGDADLTGYTAAGQIRRTYSSSTYWDFICTITHPTSGIIEIKLPNSVTNAMKAGRYVYDIEIKQTSTGEIGRVIEGQVQITAGVTRD